MAKKLTEAHEFILNLLVDKGSRHRDWIAEIAKQKGYRVVNRSINSLLERGMIAIDEDDYVTLAQPTTVTAQAAQSISDFDPGDEVVIRRDAIMEHVAYIADELIALRDNRVVGKVVSVRELPFGDPIKVQFPNDYYCFMANELELWKPAEPEASGDVPAMFAPAAGVYSVQIGTLPEGLSEGSTTTWAAAELARRGEVKDEYTRDEEQARLLARIRELEEALEGLHKLVAGYAPFSRPGNSSFEVLARKVYEATTEALADAVGE